jgi:hypothetical protein
VSGLADIQTVSIVVAAASVVAGVIYYAFQIRHQTRTRDTDLVTRLQSIYTSKEYQDAYGQVLSLKFVDYDDFTKKYGSLFSNNPVSTALRMVCGFNEQLGVLYYRKLVDINLVGELFTVRRPWEKVRPIAEGARKEFNQPGLYEWFEYLYNQMQKRGLDQSET